MRLRAPDELRPDDLTIGERGFFCETKHPIGKPKTPLRQLFQTLGPLVGPDLLNAESNLGKCHCGLCQFRVEPKPGHHGLVSNLPQRLRDNVGIERYQSSMPGEDHGFH